MTAQGPLSWPIPPPLGEMIFSAYAKVPFMYKAPTSEYTEAWRQRQGTRHSNEPATPRNINPVAEEGLIFLLRYFRILKLLFQGHGMN
jgi:hypothetical protein